MKRFKLWASLVLVAAVLLAGLIGWWAIDVRWRPKTVDKHPAEIARLLESAGWVSPGLGPKRVYVITATGCPACQAFEADALKRLHEDGVDTRIIVVAPPEATAAERATVAQLWTTRSWALLTAWRETEPGAWTALGIPAADGDMARTAVIEAGRRMVQDLSERLDDNGLRFHYPLLVWWTAEGEMRACACEKPQAWRRAVKEVTN